VRALAVSLLPGAAARVRASDKGYRLARPMPHSASPAMASAGWPASQNIAKPAAVSASDTDSSRTVRPARRIRYAPITRLRRMPR